MGFIGFLGCFFRLGFFLSTLLKRLNLDIFAFQYREVELNLLGKAPTYQDTLPFQIFRLVKFIVLAIPTIPGWHLLIINVKV